MTSPQLLPLPAQSQVAEYQVAPVYCTKCGEITGTSTDPQTGITTWTCGGRAVGCPHAVEGTVLN